LATLLYGEDRAHLTPTAATRARTTSGFQRFGAVQPF
jgi:hypothetical protein